MQQFASMLCLNSAARCVLGIGKSKKMLNNAKRCLSQNHATYFDKLSGRLGIIGVPFGKGQKETGKKEDGLIQAPDAIRSTGFIDDLKELGLDIKDYGNITYQPLGEEVACSNMKNLNHVASCMKELSSNVRQIISDSRTCLTLGGDHSLCIGSIAGHSSVIGIDNTAVLYVDAHADINVNTTSPSGNIHGMPLALLAQELASSWPNYVPGFCDWLSPCIFLKNLAYIGLRSVDSGERRVLEKFSIATYTMKEVQQYGINHVIDMALKQIDPNDSKSIHLSFDIDALDYHEAPATTLPVRGGLTLREGLEIVETVGKTKRLGAFDIVEVNPLLGNELQTKITLDAAKHLLLGLFGHSRKGNIV